jgi:pilus assembly protein CpaC
VIKAVSRIAVATLLMRLVAFALPAQAQELTFLSLQSGHSTVVRAPGLSRVAVGDSRIAGVIAIGTSEVIINAKSAGHTTVSIWGAGGARTEYEVTVTQQDADDLARALRSTLADSNVSVVTVGHMIVVRGTIMDSARFTQANSLIDRFNVAAKTEGFVIVDALTQLDPLTTVQSDIGAIAGASDVRVEGDGKGNIVVSGRATTKATEQMILERARTLAGTYLASDGKVIDRLELATVSQVSVKVYVLEVDETGMKQLGLRLQGAFVDPTTGLITPTTPSFPFVENQANQKPGRSLTIGGFFRSILLAPTLDLILTSGHASVLSAPDLLAMPGQTANFLVGGQIPYIYSTGLGQSAIVFKEYGVKLEITPTILGDGSIETKLTPEISDLDFTNGISLNGFIVPALKTSRITTDLVTHAGESIIMGGLLRRLDQKTITKIPGLGDLPVLGKLFRSTNYLTSASDVVFVMTPEIITQ